MSKLQLPQVTLICLDCYNYGPAVNALQKSMEQVDFAAVKFLTDIQIKIDGIEVIKVPRINSKEEYSEFIIKQLYKYFYTDYVLIVQHDGYVLDAGAWKDEFLEYDYLGSAWLYTDQRNVGNGGFSLRSQRLHLLLSGDSSIEITHPEDEIIGRLYRSYLEKYGIKFPTDELADSFAFELRQPNQPTFGFHGKFHVPYKPYVVVKRSAALGDIVLIEPILKHFHEQGYNVVVDIPPQFFDLYIAHYFPVYHKSQIDWGRITADKVVNLDMAYEVKPHQNYLQSYFEMAGIKEFELTRPQLWPKVDERTKPFKKYCVLHIDKRDQMERNIDISDADWWYIKKELHHLGITLIQIGLGQHTEVGLEYNTSSMAHAKWLISGADLFIGIDSGMSHIAVASNIPSVIFFGSVDPQRIHCDLENVEALQGDCDKKHCWHIPGGTEGKTCAYIGTDKSYQCTKITWQTVVDAIKKLMK